MRDMVTCFSEHAVRISETTCSSHITKNKPSIYSTLNAVVCAYKTHLLSTHKQFLITVTWCRNHMGLGHGGLTITFGDDQSKTLKLNLFSRFFNKKKGHKLFEIDSSKIEFFWDLSSAVYHSGAPEPTEGYYVDVMIDSELVLILGDRDLARTQYSMSKSVLVSRREHYSGNALYSTKAQFCDSGVVHEIVIQCGADHRRADHDQPVLYVSIDKKIVMKIRRLQWNFRGNQTMFVDGLLVDLMWDVHDWLFNPDSGSAVFMFKTRCGGESRLWFDDKMEKEDQERGDFSLVIYGSKN